MDLLSVFKRGSAGPASVDSAPSLDSVANARRRARQRLIGASILVLIGVVGFPLVFDSAPRPVSIDVPIVIPRKDGAAPLAMPSGGDGVTAGAGAAASSGSAGAGSSIASANPSTQSNGVVITEGKDDAGVEVKPPVPDTRASMGQPGPPHVAKPVKPAEKPAIKPTEKPTEKPALAKAEPSRAAEDASRAKALLENKPVAKVGVAPAAPKPAATPTPATSPATTSPTAPATTPAGDTRFAIQVAAFASEPPVHEMRGKLEKAGVKSYTQVIETPQGKRYRVRVGPFASRDDAERAAGKIKAAGLPSSIVPL